MEIPLSILTTFFYDHTKWAWTSLDHSKNVKEALVIREHDKAVRGRKVVAAMDLNGHPAAFIYLLNKLS